MQRMAQNLTQKTKLRAPNYRDLMKFPTIRITQLSLRLYSFSSGSQIYEISSIFPIFPEAVIDT